MKLRIFHQLAKKFINLIITINVNNIPKLIRFYKSYKQYKYLNKFEKLNTANFYPCIHDNTTTTTYDAHYFYQGVWAFNLIKRSKIKIHIDVGSEIRWVGLLSVITKVVFVDIRPLKIDLNKLISKKGNILNMPFEDNSVNSLSCLHVAEHIGLGRYGDKIDPEGTKKACKELSRILSVNGNLYFSVPVGIQKIYFNAHRVHSTKTIIEYFSDLELIELSGVTDSGQFVENIKIDKLESSRYACGLFWFKKKNRITNYVNKK